MTLKHRVIPIILTDGGFFAVQTTKYQRPVRQIGTLNQYIENMEKRNIDELILLDIDGSLLKNKYYNKIKSITKNLFCPITFGGGVKTLNDIKILIQECGVDKVAIRTNFSLIYSAARQFGSQAIVYSLDYKDGNIPTIPIRIKYEKWARQIQTEGAGEILLTDTNQNGTFRGYNLGMIGIVAKEVTIPIIANGGCGSPNDMIAAIQYGASAVAASSMFSLRSVTPQDCARALQDARLPARVL